MANYLPFNSIDHDRVYKAEDWAWYFSTFIGNGVFPNPSTGLQVVADDGMTVAVKAGYGFINGYAFRNTSDYSITISTADGSLGRIDRVVLRWDLTNRQMILDVLQGTASADPTATALTRTADIYELALADISVTAGLTTITQSHITDRRTDTDLCGIVEGTVSQIDWSTLTAQLNAFLEEYSTAVVSDYANYTEQITTFETTFESDANTWMSGQQTALEAWVETLHDILDTETATHLLNLIETLTAQVGIPDEYDPEQEYAAGALRIYENTLYRCTTATSVGTFDPTCWRATTVLDEIDAAIADAKDEIYTEMAKGSLVIDSDLSINDDGDQLIINEDSDTLAVRQTVKLNFV